MNYIMMGQRSLALQVSFSVKAARKCKGLDSMTSKVPFSSESLDLSYEFYSFSDSGCYINIGTLIPGCEEQSVCGLSFLHKINEG